jgi:hypothetical protein
MNLDWLSRAAGTGVLAAALSAQATHSQTAELSSLLSSVAKYLAEYEQRCGAVVSLETYLQQVQSGGSRQSRQLKSDMLVLSVGDAGWVGFRDVFEVDGRSVRDHEERLFALFLKPSSDSLGQARKILDESSRFNIGRITRNVNIPTMALTYFKGNYQSRSKFIDKGTDVVDRVRTREIEFREQALPRVINTSDGAAAMGRVWIDPESGRVVKTVLMLTGAVRATSPSGRSLASAIDARELPSCGRNHRRPCVVLQLPKVQRRRHYHYQEPLSTGADAEGWRYR